MKESKELANVLKVLSVDTRVEMVRLLKGGVLCVNALACRLGVTAGAVSQHLRVMREAGLVIDEKRGYYVHYRLNEETMASWRREIDALLDPKQGAGKGEARCAAAKKTKGARNRRT